MDFYGSLIIKWSPGDPIVINGSRRINRDADNTVSGEILTFNALCSK